MREERKEKKKTYLKDLHTNTSTLGAAARDYFSLAWQQVRLVCV